MNSITNNTHRLIDSRIFAQHNSNMYYTFHKYNEKDFFAYIQKQKLNQSLKTFIKMLKRNKAHLYL